MKLNSQLKYFRQRSGFTQKKVADAIGIDKTTYAHYELGNRVPSAEMWVKLSEILKFNVFPAQIQEVYPEKLLDSFEKCIKENCQPSTDIKENNLRCARIMHSLNEIYKIRAETMDTNSLPLDKLQEIMPNAPYTVMNVALDIRAEYLIEKALECVDELIKVNQNI